MAHEDQHSQRQAGPLDPGRPGRHRVCQRPGRQPLGLAPRQGRPPGPVPSEVHGDRQRERRAGLRGPLPAVLRCHQGQVPGDDPRGQHARPHRGPWTSSTSITTTAPSSSCATPTSYDTYDRKTSPKIYVGEYAVTQGCGKGNLRAAVGEAAFMTGMERNSDIVVMASYAPLFVNCGWRQWNPNAIDFDNVAGLRHAFLPRAEDVQRQSRRRGAGARISQAPAVESPLQGRGDRRRHLGHAGRVQGHQGHPGRQGALPVRISPRDSSGWRTHHGHWQVKDGALQQTEIEDGRAGRRRRQVVEGLHAHAQGPQAGRRPKAS